MKIRIIFLFLSFSFFGAAQQQDAWVFFTDKANVEESIANPISILSQRAIDRKALHNIAIDARDVPVNQEYINSIESADGITVMAKSKWFNSVHVRGELNSIQSLSDFTFVSQIQYADKTLNGEGEVVREINGEPYEETTIHTTNRTEFTYGSAQNQTEMIKADVLHEEGFTGEGMLVAVIDGGFPNVNSMGAFQRLRDNNKLLGGYDFVDRTDDVYASNATEHGTFVLSTMAAYIENEFVGTAPDASYYLFRTEDAEHENPVEESYWVEAAERADSLGVNVINSSLGYIDFDNANYNYSQDDLTGDTTFITQGANIAFEKGLLVVNSAGNDGEFGLLAPADAPGVLTIAAVDQDGNYAFFSSIGSSTQPTQKPDVAAQGDFVAVVSPDNEVTDNLGTSFSSPIMAGAITCFWQAAPNKTNAEIMQLVRESASQYNNPDYEIGYGIPDFSIALNQVLNINEQNINDFKIYPNPVANTLKIEFLTTEDPVSLKIYNMSGQLVFQNVLKTRKNTISLNFLEKGNYIVTLASHDMMETFKMIKK